MVRIPRGAENDCGPSRSIRSPHSRGDGALLKKAMNGTYPVAWYYPQNSVEGAKDDIKLVVLIRCGPMDGELQPRLQNAFLAARPGPG
jgi:hypothetical protein